MEKKDYAKPKKTTQRSDVSEDRRASERRKSKGDGYTYIPMVGWYCRREESRRDDDDFQ